MKLAVDADHAGYSMKGPVVEFLRARGHEVTDHGTDSEDPVEFPDIAQRVVSAILSGEAERAVLVCGTGVDASIAGNKVPDIRAMLAHDTHCAHQGVEHDDVDLICMGAWILGIALAKEVLDAFINAKFSADPENRSRVPRGTRSGSRSTTNLPSPEGRRRQLPRRTGSSGWAAEVIVRRYWFWPNPGPYLPTTGEARRSRR